MGLIRDSEQLYQIFDHFFSRVSKNELLVSPLLAGNFILRFRYSDPDAVLTIDLRGPKLVWFCGPCELTPDLEMIQSANVAHEFWLGQLNVPTAIATRKVVARGSVPKALKLLPAVKPTFAVYADTLRALDLAHLLPKTSHKQTSKVQAWLSELNQKLGQKTSIDFSSLNQHAIEFIENLPDSIGHKRSVQTLPANENALKLCMFRRMVEIRELESTLARENAAGRIPTEAVHLSIGQEATAVGACFALQSDDYMATTHRGHGHMLAKGAPIEPMLAEILGKATGLCKGKGGSMHVTDASVGAIGANGIVGASPLMAIGAAFASLQRGSSQVAMAFLGDGATNQGMFHEALNFASVFKLPALFVIENNLYGEFTSVKEHTGIQRLSTRADAYGMPGETVDGNDVWAVYQAVSRAVERARRGEGPSLLECLTYRWHGHMEGDQYPYREQQEIAAWMARCPIASWKQVLINAQISDNESLECIEASVKQEVAQALARAHNAPEPDLKEAYTDIFAPEPADLYRPTQNQPSSREMTCSRALWEAIAEEMERDERVYLLGEDVSYGGYFAVTSGLVERFGKKRVVDTPISEYAIVGSAVGAAMAGARPIAEILFSDFLTTCMDPIINQAAKLRYMSGGQYQVPLVIRTPGGAGLGMAAQHSQSLEALLCGIPGLIVLAPGSPADAKGLLKSAIRSNNPVLFFENKLLYMETGPVPEGEYLVPIGRADIKRVGHDVTLVSVGAALGKSLEAANLLANEGIDVEIVDVRTLVPLDRETIVRSVAKTKRLVTVEDGTLFHGFGAEIIARVAEVAWALLLAPPKRVGAKFTPIAYNSRLENETTIDSSQIASTIRQCMSESGRQHWFSSLAHSIFSRAKKK